MCGLSMLEGNYISLLFLTCFQGQNHKISSRFPFLSLYPSIPLLIPPFPSPDTPISSPTASVYATPVLVVMKKRMTQQA